MLRAVLTVFLVALPSAIAQSCISLADSKQCPAFNASAISTGSALSSQFPFLAFVSNVQQFDSELSQYITTNYIQLKYQRLLGCGNVNLTNTENLYARYTTSVICNTIIQQSIQPCSLSPEHSRPLCAEACAQQATSEERIAVNEQLCGGSSSTYLDQIRADFTNCALPSDSLSARCIPGEENEPFNCGFSTNLQGLCGYCSATSPNATDSCCVGSNVTNRCTGVTLPIASAMPPLFPSTTSSSASSATSASNTTSNTDSDHHGLDGGQIAGIVIGVVLGTAALILVFVLLCCTEVLGRWRNRDKRQNVFNQPSPQRKSALGMSMVQQPENQDGQNINDGQFGGRVARMAALEGTSSDSPSYGNTGADVGGRRYGETSDSEGYGQSPETRHGGRPVTGKRNGSLSSQSILGGLDDHSSPNSGSGEQFSSPEGVASGQSEQLPAFKDYYSQDEIHAGDKVATLWAYQPRAGDEFELERGDMLKVVGIWDDGWATGIRIDERAETYDAKRKLQRDSGVSNGSGQRAGSPSIDGEIKAFPLVCVCLPEHWKSTIEGDIPEGPG